MTPRQLILRMFVMSLFVVAAVAGFKGSPWIIVAALGESPDLAALCARTEALCAKRPLYPGFRGWTTYVT